MLLQHTNEFDAAVSTPNNQHAIAQRATTASSLIFLVNANTTRPVHQQTKPLSTPVAHRMSCKGATCNLTVGLTLCEIPSVPLQLPTLQRARLLSECARRLRPQTLNTWRLPVLLSRGRSCYVSCAAIAWFKTRPRVKRQRCSKSQAANNSNASRGDSDTFHVPLRAPTPHSATHCRLCHVAPPPLRNWLLCRRWCH